MANTATSNAGQIASVQRFFDAATEVLSQRKSALAPLVDATSDAATAEPQSP